MFIEKLKTINLEKMLLTNQEFQPFPCSEERRRWDMLPEELKQAIVKDGEAYLSYEWPSLPAVRFMDYRRDGNRSRYEALHFERRRALVSLIIAECVQGQDRFIDDIINGIWCICEESFWGVPAHNYNSRNSQDSLPDIAEPIIDLFAAETAGLVAWGHYLLKNRLDKVSTLICERIEIETKRRILDPFLERDDFWWMGYDPKRKVNNWNPWIHSNCLTAFLIFEKDTTRRIRAVEKSMVSLDKFMDVYHSDGGCDEGTSYWGHAGASLFDCLELLYHATEGKVSFYDEPIVKEIGRFIYKSYIIEDYFINFADGGAKVKISSDLVYRYGKRIADEKLMAMGSGFYHLYGSEKQKIASLLRELPEIFNYSELKSAASSLPYIKDSWLDGIQVMAARETEDTNKGLYLAAKGGHNDESHNHNDIGQYIVYSDGKPLIIDVGVETYTAKTFSSRRYEIWTMQSAYHNLPTVNGIQQEAGESFRASEVTCKASEDTSELTMNIGTAYPEAAGINYWIRTFRLNRTGMASIEIMDNFKLNKASSDIMLSLMTPVEPETNTEGRIYLSNETGKHLIEFNEKVLEVRSECISVEDARLTPVWGDKLYRIILQVKSPILETTWTMKITKL